LEGVKTNRAAFGTRICVTVAGTQGKRHIYRTVGYGSSFGGNPFQQHIGLGKNAAIDDITVTWPTSGLVQRFQHVAADRSYHLREGDNELAPIAQKQFSISADHMKMRH
jgi:hypothetical protein